MVSRGAFRGPLRAAGGIMTKFGLYQREPLIFRFYTQNIEWFFRFSKKGHPLNDENTSIFVIYEECPLVFEKGCPYLFSTHLAYFFNFSFTK